MKVVQNYLKAGVHQNVHLNDLETGVNITSSRVWRKSGAERRRERGSAVPASATASELEICRFVMIFFRYADLLMIFFRCEDLLMIFFRSADFS